MMLLNISKLQYRSSKLLFLRFDSLFRIPPSDISIRLQGSSVPYAGRVEVLYAGIWGAISRIFSARYDGTLMKQQLFVDSLVFKVAQR